MNHAEESKRFWNAAASSDATWYTATGFAEQNDEYFGVGAREVDTFLPLIGAQIALTDEVLEIGCGVGRMTRQLATRAARVVAADVSGEMIARAKVNLVDYPNVDFLELDGDGSIPLETASVDRVFSYITMQHVASEEDQDRYLSEAIRVIRPGGWVAMQFRRTEFGARVLDWRGFLGNFARGKKTLDRSWRGAYVHETVLRAHRSHDVSVDVFRIDERHLWLLARRS